MSAGSARDSVSKSTKFTAPSLLTSPLGSKAVFPTLVLWNSAAAVALSPTSKHTRYEYR